MLKTEIFEELLFNDAYDPRDYKAHRNATLAGAEIQAASDHIQPVGAKKKLNLLCAREAVSMNTEWLKIMKDAVDKMEEISTAIATCKGDEEANMLLEAPLSVKTVRRITVGTDGNFSKNSPLLFFGFLL